MDRREFLTTKRKPAAKHSSAPAISSPAAGGIAPYAGPWTNTEVVHLLKRTMFGAAKADVDYFKLKTMSDAVDELINPTAPLPAPPLKEYDPTGATVQDTSVAPGTTWVNDNNTDGTIAGRRIASFKKWWTGLMINQDRSIREKMTMFWHNHFATETDVLGYGQYVYKHHNLLRTNSLGNFKALVKLVTTDPGMLIYLNGNNSLAPNANLNYARELQELFTVGKENTLNYTEDDVIAAAKALTGWQVVSSTISSTFTLSRHDKTNKQFSSFYNNTVITGRNTATAGDQEIDDLLTMIFNKKTEVSRYIVKKIYRWFCYYTVDDTIQTTVINPLADIFQQSNWDIKPVLSALFKSEHFYDAALRGCMIKSPVDLVAGLFREFKVAFPDSVTAYVDAYYFFELMRSSTFNMYQDIGKPDNVSGWPAYYQAPQFYELWINTNSLPIRNTFTDNYIGNGTTRNGFTVKIDAVAFAKSTSNPGNPNTLINDSLEILFQVPLSVDSIQTIKVQTLLSGQATDTYWTEAWIAYQANPLVTGTPYKTVSSRLVLLYKYLLELAEYQLM